MHARVTTSAIRRGINFLCWAQWDGNDAEADSRIAQVSASYLTVFGSSSVLPI